MSARLPSTCGSTVSTLEVSHMVRSSQTSLKAVRNTGIENGTTSPFSQAHLAATHSCIQSPTRVNRHSWCLIGGRSWQLARLAEIDVLDDLQRLIFPWVREAALAEFEERFEADELCQDKALVGHLKLIQRFKLVILQNAAFLIQTYPDAPIYQTSLFQSDRFRTWAPHLVASVEGNGREEAAPKVVYGGLLDSIVDSLGAQQSSERRSATAHLRSDNR
ncbi:hypothetical protein MVLG_03281 [Microbotryum lychnidis-dioicae p1A1 Lamole]|uniref:Ndc10 domain-containing protein n=1 Tax=Microbotryum lychnidis-dioicae (strain p1A1 Lamole / MvSl-1064) TaxID=683840 RepID=U5H7Q9_USTV1|nr:hypothetical protein MVLG_03281 [Microbotryum lychnidis-dioicae p1A1 Lamole]|eukprot:KDE06373.1 hypothetical protein MVLG_03281 [Microbotryum lychnidis-dioicae p1A1 Lamole]